MQRHQEQGVSKGFGSAHQRVDTRPFPVVEAMEEVDKTSEMRANWLGGRGYKTNAQIEEENLAQESDSHVNEASGLLITIFNWLKQ